MKQTDSGRILSLHEYIYCGQLRKKYCTPHMYMYSAVNNIVNTCTLFNSIVTKAKRLIVPMWKSVLGYTDFIALYTIYFGKTCVTDNICYQSRYSLSWIGYISHKVGRLLRTICFKTVIQQLFHKLFTLNSYVSMKQPMPYLLTYVYACKRKWSEEHGIHSHTIKARV